MNEVTVTLPEWAEGNKINEILFCQDFLTIHPMVSVGGSFFTVDGIVSDENLLKKQIYDYIKHHVTTGLSKKVSNLLEVLRMECSIEDLPAHTDRIHVANGTLYLDGDFTAEKSFCRNRLPVNYNKEAAMPTAWLAFCSNLFYEEDISVVQEFMGYCLIPSTKGQKMLLIVGKGGEGKSRVGIVLQSILGSNMKSGSIAKVENSLFARADLQNMLVMVDDDMKMEALTQTNNLKAIVTSELPMDLEKKGQQSYQGDLWVRFLAFGNGNLRALHDRSYGFFRRQIILEAKPRDPNRKDDPYLTEKLCAEKEGIFLWALEGLQRLIQNNYRFTISDRASANMEAAMADGNNIVEFMKSEGYFCFKADYEVSSRDFYEVYKMWCADNALNPLPQKTLSNFLKQNEDTYNLEYTNKVHIGNGRYARGFMGIELLQRP